MNRHKLPERSLICPWLLVVVTAFLGTTGRSLAATPLERAASALDQFRLTEARQLLEQALSRSRLRHAEHVRVYELLGITCAFSDDLPAARRAFQMLLALDPRYAIPYNLNPKVTFAFEQVRTTLRGQPQTELQLSWPRGLSVSDGLPVTIETVVDRKRLLSSVELRLQLRGGRASAVRRLALPRAGRYVRVDFPPIAAGSRSGQVLELSGVVRDQRGNEVMLLGSRARPHANVALRYSPPPAWYTRWWVWALGAVLVGSVAGTTTYLLTRGPPDTVTGVVE